MHGNYMKFIGIGVAFTVCLFTIFLVGCIRSTEIALAPNIVRVDTEASGFLSVGKANSEVIKKAAQTTTRRGYSHFLISGHGYGKSVIPIGASHHINGIMVGNRIRNNIMSIYDSHTYSNVILMPVEHSSVIIVMFKKGDRIPQSAFDAMRLLKSIEKQTVK